MIHGNPDCPCACGAWHKPGDGSLEQEVSDYLRRVVGGMRIPGSVLKAKVGKSVPVCTSCLKNPVALENGSLCRRCKAKNVEWLVKLGELAECSCGGPTGHVPGGIYCRM